jgi:hypothetical protein
MAIRRRKSPVARGGKVQAQGSCAVRPRGENHLEGGVEAFFGRPIPAAGLGNVPRRARFGEASSCRQAMSPPSWQGGPPTYPRRPLSRRRSPQPSRKKRCRFEIFA